MPVFVSIMEEYKQVKLLQDELENKEGIKKQLEVEIWHFELFWYQNIAQSFKQVVEKNGLDKDGFLDWTEYMALVMDARSTYTNFDLNGEWEIDQDEMDAVVASIKESGDELMTNEMRENFDIMLFYSNGDEKVSISEYVNALRNIKVLHALLISTGNRNS